MFIARTKLGGRKKKIIRRKTIGLSTEKWKDLIIIRTNAIGFPQKSGKT